MSPNEPFAVPDTVTLTRGVAYGRDQAQVLDVYAPTEDVPSPTGDPTRRPAVVLVHGGGWTTGSPANYHVIATGFATVGWVAVSVGYRLGDAGIHPAAERDVADAVAHVADQAEAWALDPDRLVLAGDSAGGQLAALAAMSDDTPAAALVAWSGLYDLDRVIDQVDGTEDAWVGRQLADHLGCPHADAEGCVAAVAPDASPIDHVTADDPPTLLLHSEDEVIPLADAQAMRDALLDVGVDVRLRTFPGGRHGLALTGVSLESIQDFLTETLDLAPPPDAA